MDVDPFHTYPASAVVHFQHSGGSIVPAKILGPSERGADYRTITYERSGTVVTHDCARITLAEHQCKSRFICVPFGCISGEYHSLP